MTTAAIDDVLGDLGDLDPWAAAAASDSEPASSSTSGATDAAPPGPTPSLPARTSLSSKAQSAAESARSREGQAGPSRPRSPSSPSSTTPSAPASRQRSRAASGASATTGSGLGVASPSSSSPYNPALPLSPSPLSPLYQPPSGAPTDAPRLRTRAGTGGSSSSAAGAGVTASLGVPLTRSSRSASHPLALDSAGLSPSDTASTGAVSALSMSPSGSAYGRAPRGVTATATAGGVSSPSGAAPPPLSLGRLRDALAEEADPDVSRPSLRRVTSETERAVAESISQSQSRAESEGASERSDAAREMVEVIVHLVRPAESLPGIALRYGIELPVLRKANKLWPSDPVHLRTKLYVPLDACRSSAAGVHIVRGPDEGQVTVIPHRKKPNGGVHTNGHSRDNSEPDLGLGTSLDDGLAVLNGTVDLTPMRPVDALPVEHDDSSDEAAAGDTYTPEPVVLDLVRLPASQLRFFPRGKRRETARARASLDNEHGRSADGVRALSAMDAELRRNRHLEQDRERARSVSASNLFAPLGAEAAAARAEAEAEAAASGAAKPKRPAVRLRPPQALPKAAPQTFAGRIQSLFTVPPPPVYPPLGRRVGSSASSSRRGSGGANTGAAVGGPHTRAASESPKIGETTPPLPSGSVFAELLEMDARTPPPLRGSPRKTDKKRD